MLYSIGRNKETQTTTQEDARHDKTEIRGIKKRDVQTYSRSVRAGQADRQGHGKSSRHESKLRKVSRDGREQLRRYMERNVRRFTQERRNVRAVRCVE